MQQSLSPGLAKTITQNVVYSLPTRLCYVTSSAAVDISVDNSTWNALTGANTVGAYTSAQFIRCTTASPVVLCKV